MGTATRSGGDPGAMAGEAVARDNAARARESATQLAAPAPLVMMGSLGHRERVALPRSAIAVVELREFAASGDPRDGKVVAEQRIPLDGRQLPVPYSLYVERNHLLPALRHELLGYVRIGDRVAWRSTPVPIDITLDRIDTGQLVLRARP